MSDFEQRERFSLEKARELVKTGNMIKHILINDDNTYSVMSHINCEFCDYCDLYNEWWYKQESDGLSYEEICKLEKPVFAAKSDPYEIQKIRMPENYGLISDGYQTWSIKCPTCKEESMKVVRPGKVQCINCG